jgi:hypothetical protein
VAKRVRARKTTRANSIDAFQNVVVCCLSLVRETLRSGRITILRGSERGDGPEDRSQDSVDRLTHRDDAICRTDYALGAAGWPLEPCQN